MANNAVNLLAALHNDAVHNYAWELVERGHIPQGVELLINNIRPGERDRFDILFKQLDLSVINDTVFEFYKACRTETFDSPDNLLFYLYENSNTDLRNLAVLEILRRRLADEAFMEELLCDESWFIRRARHMILGDKK